MTTQAMLDDKLLKAFVEGFYGYGDYRARTWFVGLEEGGGNSVAEVQRRLQVWDRRGRRELEDVAEYHRVVCIGEFFQEPIRSQRTWNKLIRILLSLQRTVATLAAVKGYQATLLGRSGGDTALVELLPLPSPSVGKWLYPNCSRLPFLQDRDSYRRAVVVQRIDRLRQRLAQYGPTLVILYGASPQYRCWWENLAEVRFRERRLDGRPMYDGANATTRFVIVHHPAAKGVANRYFEEVGRMLRGVAG